MIAELLVFGRHVTSLATFRLNRIAVGFRHLEKWVATPAFGPASGDDTPEDGLARTELPPPRILEGLAVSHELTTRGDPHLKVLRKHRALLELVAADRPWEWWAGTIRHLQRLLSLLIHRVTRPSVIYGFGPEQSLPASILYAVPATTDESSLDWRDVALPLESVRAHLPAVLEEWFAKRDMLEPVLDLYSDARENDGLGLASTILQLTTAIEVWHRRCRGGIYLEPEEYAAAIGKLLECQPVGLPDGLSDRIRNTLKHANEFSLRKRFQQIRASLSADSGALGLLGSDVFWSKVIETRNYLTHLGEASDAVYPPRLYWVVERRLVRLLSLLLLKETGLPEELIVEGLYRAGEGAILVQGES